MRSGTRRIIRALPAERRAKGLGGAKGRRLLQARKLIAPWLQWTVTVTTATGLRLRLTGDPVDEQIAHHLLGPRRDRYFPDWPHDAPAPRCILDIGAHHGLYAAAALHTYPEARIICVEPSAHAREVLQANLDCNGFSARARVVAAGLASAPGSGLLRHTAEGTWGASLFEEESIATSSEPVTLASLDEILGDDSPDLIKCNAEGAEFSLLEQLERRDLRPTLMIVMVHPEFGDMAALVAHAERMGYRIESTGTDHRPSFQMWRIAERAERDVNA
jgi:FkbM family methyltransferase